MQQRCNMVLEKTCDGNTQKQGLKKTLLRKEVEGSFTDESKLEWAEEEDLGEHRMIQWGEQEPRLLDMVQSYRGMLSWYFWSGGEEAFYQPIRETLSSFN